MEMTVDLDLIDSAFSQREAALCFLSSRMWCIDDGTLRARVKIAHLWFEDFLECLVRVALTMSLPTDNEVAESGYADAGTYLLDLKAQDDREEFVMSHMTGDWQEPRQPVERAVEHLLTLVIRTVEMSAKKSPADMILTRKEVGKFRAAAREVMHKHDA